MSTSTTITPPSEAAAAGYTTLVLNDNFDTNTISPNGQGIYTWYPVDGLTAYSESNGTLTISSDTSGFGAGLSTVPDNGNDPNAALSTPGSLAVNTGNGVVYKYGYFQATLSFNPSGYTGSGDWPAFWMGHDQGGPANPDGDFDELDILEGIPGWPPKAGVAAQNTATLHEWAPGYVAASPQHAFNPTQNINFTQSNTFGMLWTPTQVSIYLNNVLQGTVAIGPGTPYPSAAIDFNSLILGTGYNWPVKFTNVEVWQSGTLPGSSPSSPGSSPTAPAPTPSPNDTVVNAGSTSAITDAAGNHWTITSGGQVAVNGVADTTTAGVIELAYVNGEVWQENQNDDWWGKTSATASWSPSGGTTVSPLPSSTSTQTDTLTLNVSETAYEGDAQFIVKVGGTQVGGTLTANALHASGNSEVFVLQGSWGSGGQSVQIQFLNPANGGSSATTRSLSVDSVAYNGTTYAGATSILTAGTADSFSVGGSTATATAPADTLTLHLSEDAYEGDAQFIMTLDGKTVTTPESVTTLHSSGQTEAFAFSGNFGAGTHTVGIEFTNDAYGGSAALDRNLYSSGVTVNGTNYGSGTTALYSTGNTATYTFSTTH